MDDGAAVLMFESGWFGQGDAFWRWVETAEAKPYVEAFARSYAPPEDGEAFDLLGDDEAGPDVLDPDHLDRLAEDIEARFGKGAHRSVSADDRPTPPLGPSPDDEELPF
jgi:hypothetical protein